MPRLFWKLFGAFWLTTIVILAITVFVSFRIAHEQSEENRVDPREVDAQLQAILETAGIDGLKKHVRNTNSFPPGRTVYLVDQQGNDLLNRPLPERVQRRALRIRSAIGEHHRDRRGGDRRFRRIRQSMLETPDGKLLLAMPGPAPALRFGFFSSGSGRWTILIVAAAISLFVFWLLSRSLARPMSKISETATQLASGDMSARVGANTYSNDEIGRLALQFDRMAEELDAQSRMRREMFRNIAHELRAPLTRLQIATELLERKPEKPLENLERVRYEIQRIESLASQVLSLARAEHDLNPSDVTPLTEVTDQITEDAKFEAASRQVRITYDCASENLQVRGSRLAIASAIENVVRNAVQHTPEGGEVVLQVTDGSSCVVTVSDNGPGVPDEALTRIFEPFYRIDTNRPGAGVGLAITQRVLRQVGGEVSAMNRPDGGLTITMRFPRPT